MFFFALVWTEDLNSQEKVYIKMTILFFMVNCDYHTFRCHV